MTIDIECDYAAQDYVDANFLHMRLGRWLYFSVLGFFASFVIVLALDDYLAPLPAREPAEREATCVSASTWTWLGVGIAYFVGSYYLYIPWRARRVFAQSKGLQLLTQYSFSDEGLSVENATSNETIPWDHIRKWREDRKLFLLYANDVMFYMIPKRSVGDQERIGSLRTLLNAHAKRVR